MNFAVRCPRKAVNFNHSDVSFLSPLRKTLMYSMNSINLSNMPTPPYFWWARHLLGVEQTIPLNEIEEHIVTNWRKYAPNKHIHILY